MKDWIKINSYRRLDQAALCKDILENNNVDSVILTKRDSAFMLGEYELYVEENNADRGNKLLDDFNGLRKINSFDTLEPVNNLKEIVEAAGIPTITISKSESPSLLTNYELYIDKENEEKAEKILSNIEGWTKVESYEKGNQTAILTNLLTKNDIRTIIIKCRNTDEHIEEIQLYTPEDKAIRAKEIISTLNGWTKITILDKYHQVELHENIFEKNDILLYVNKIKEFESLDSDFELFVQHADIERANELVGELKVWKKIDSFSNMYLAELRQGLLEENNIETVIVKKKDSSFLLGIIEIFVEMDNADKALELIKNYNEIDEDIFGILGQDNDK